MEELKDTFILFLEITEGACHSEDGDDPFNDIVGNLLEGHLRQHQDEKVIVVSFIPVIHGNEHEGEVIIEGTEEEESVDEGIIEVPLVTVVFVLGLPLG